MERSRIDDLFSGLLAAYPQEFREMVESNRSRTLWQVDEVTRIAPAGGRIADIGAGVLPFMAICQQLGYSTLVVDDYRDATYPRSATDAVLSRFKDLGVTIFENDIFEDTSFLAELGSLDLVVTHHSMEHWHNSPKSLFHELWANLREGGALWIGVPNCVNLRKRLTVPFGFGKWSQMQDWYEEPVFRGHVREPDVDDLEYIARDLRARRIRISGMNWLGYRSPKSLVRLVVPLVDRPLRLFPSLCSDIYLVAWK